MSGIFFSLMSVVVTCQLVESVDPFDGDSMVIPYSSEVVKMNKLLLMLLLFTSTISAEESSCYGSTSHGLLRGGVKLENKGGNFEGYSLIPVLAGRTYVHSIVKKIVEQSYSDLLVSMPDKVFKFAETGYASGGEFNPHKTHQNGLSVDFMVPVINDKGVSTFFPTNVFNKFGYSVEFDASSRFKQYSIDYHALAAHIVSLDKNAKRMGYGLWRVIFAPEYQIHLYNTVYGNYLKKHIQFSKKRSWVRHDEHYHVDFDIPCLSLDSAS